MDEAGRGLRIVVNPHSGGRAAQDPAAELARALPAAEVVELTPAHTCDDILRRAPRPTAVGASGGDGTIAAVAAIAVDLGVPLMVVPGGTLNHFARDIGIDSVEAAVAAVRTGTVGPVDVGDIAGRLFLNNASLGSYPELVAARERWEGRIGKWPAVVVALIAVLRTGRPSVLEVDGRRRRVWLAFFGNCRYDERGLVAPAGRSRLDDGLIDVRLFHADRKFARLRLITAAMLRRLDRCSVYEAATAESVSIRGGHGRLPFAADGEVFDAPERFEITKRRRGLRVYGAGVSAG